MKNLKIFWLILSLTVLMLPSLESKTTGSTSSLIAQQDDPCGKQKTVVDDLIKQINDQNTVVAGDEKSPLEQAKEDMEREQRSLDDYRCRNPHGPETEEEDRKMENDLDKLREKYAKMLALTDQLKAAIEKFKETCRSALENDDSRENLDLKGYNLFHEEQEEAYQEKREALMKAAVYEELIRILERNQHKQAKEDCPKYYLRLLKILERRVGESEREYRKRLIDIERRYPWGKPGKGMKKDEKKERERRLKEKWPQDFWKKVKDAIKAKIKELEDNAHIKPQPPREDQGQPNDEDKTPDDENALPWKDRNEEHRTIDYRGTLFGGWQVNPGAATFEMDQMNELLNSIYEPGIFERLFEKLGGEFFVGSFSTAPVFTETNTRLGRQGGIALTREFWAHCEMGIQFTYGNAISEAHFPVTTLDFGSTDPSPVTIQGDYTLRQKSMALRTGGNYRFSNGAWQPLLGAWAGIAQQQETVTATITDVSWQLGEETRTAFGYTLEAALRWQSPGKLFLNLQGQWGQTGGNGNYGVALGLGLNFGR